MSEILFPAAKFMPSAEGRGGCPDIEPDREDRGASQGSRSHSEIAGATGLILYCPNARVKGRRIAGAAFTRVTGVTVA